jgi:hypothetical protein
VADPVSIGLAYVAQKGGDQLLAFAVQQLTRNQWRRRLARKAFKGLGRPHPKGDLDEWLGRPGTAELLFAPTSPSALDRQPLDDFLASRSARWSRLAVADRHQRVDVILGRVYEGVIAERDESGWIAHCREMAVLEQHGTALDTLIAGQQQQLDEINESKFVDFREMLRLLPPTLHEPFTERWPSSRQGMWQLVTTVLDAQTTPIAVVAEWERAVPNWLLDAPYPVLLSAADIASSYGGTRAAGQFLEMAAAAGAPNRDYWLARAAIARSESDEADHARRILAQLSDPASVPLASIVAAFLEGDSDRADRLAVEWQPESRHDRALRAVLRQQLVMQRLLGQRVTTDAVNESLRLLDEVIDEGVHTGITLGKARLLLMRARLGASVHREQDVQQALRLALLARDHRRQWRADSSEAVAVACEAAFHAHDAVGLLRIGSLPEDGGEATPAEAANEAVRRASALAAAQEGRTELARRLAGGLTDLYLRASVEAMLAMAENKDARAHWQRAFDAATTDEQRAQSMLGLASAGVAPLPELEQFRHSDPDLVLEIEAVGELARGREGDAITKLRGLRSTSYTAAINLAEAYARAGLIDEQVQTLCDAARDFGDLHLRMRAVMALMRAQRLGEAERELEAVLAAAAPDWLGRGDAVRLYADLALFDDRYEQATERLRNALAVDPSDDRVRWTLVRVLTRRGELRGAWDVFGERALEPTSVDEAMAWVELKTRFDPGEDTTRGCLTLVRRFGPSEQLSALAFANIMTRGTDEPLSDELRAELGEETEKFFEQWPESRLLRRIHVDEDDIGALVQQMTDMVRPTSAQEEHHRHLGRQLIYGQLPLGMLSAVVNRSYAEVVILRGIGFLSARHPDPAEHDAMVGTAEAALNAGVVIDTTAAVVLDLLPPDVRRQALGAFASVMTVDDVLRDANRAADALGRRSTSVWGWDSETGSGVLREFPQADADQFATDAEQLVRTVEAFQRHVRPTSRALPQLGGGEVPEAFGPWPAVLDLAQERGVPVWIDDVGLRNLARHVGLSTFSTPVLLRTLLSTARITQAEHDEAVKALQLARVGDWPLNPDYLMEIAEEEGFVANTVAGILSRPGAWVAPVATVRFFNRLAPIVASKQPGQLPAWLYAAVTGARLAVPDNPQVASNISGVLLANALINQRPTPNGNLRLIDAVKSAIHRTEAEGISTPSAVVHAARVLKDTMDGLLPPAMVVPYVLAVFQGLPEDERVSVLMAVMLQPPASSGG